jgi:hypothetical protein
VAPVTWSATGGDIRSIVVTLVGLLLPAGVIAAVASSTLGRWAQATERRREAYASAVKTLVAWLEYPYRIRRRTSDAPEELARLAGLGHDLQEQLRCHQTWIESESRRVASAYRDALAAIGLLVAPACSEAWKTPPVTKAEGMVLGSWGPGSAGVASVVAVQQAITERFGCRYVMALVGRSRRRRPASSPR